MKPNKQKVKVKEEGGGDQTEQEAHLQFVNRGLSISTLERPVSKIKSDKILENYKTNQVRF